MEQLLKVLSEGNKEYVKVIPVDHNCFNNWDTFFTNDLKYRKAVKDCSKFHCFYYDKSQNGVLHKKTTVLSNKVTKEKINKHSDNIAWKQELRKMFPILEKHPGIADIKQVELYQKWRNLVPDQYQDSICPRPSDNILLKVKRDKAKKAKDKLRARQQLLNENGTN